MYINVYFSLVALTFIFMCGYTAVYVYKGVTVYKKKYPLMEIDFAKLFIVPLLWPLLGIGIITLGISKAVSKTLDYIGKLNRTKLYQVTLGRLNRMEW